MTTVIPRALLSRIAVWAAAAACLLSAPAFAQGIHHLEHAADHGISDLFVVEIGPDGSAQCRHVDAVEAEALRTVPEAPLNLTVFPSTNAPSEITGLRILLRATDQLLEFPDALLAFRRAAARWERAISTPITVVFDVDYGPERFNSGPYGPNVLASASSAGRVLTTGGPQTIVSALKAKNQDDPQLQALYDAIPIPTPSTAGANLGQPVGTLLNFQALGFSPANMNPDPLVNAFGSVPNIGFNSAFSHDFEPADGISAGLFDFEGIAVHEMGHSLGFVSIIGSGGPPNNRFYVWDLFRVRPEAVEPDEPLDDGEGWETAERVVTPGPPNTEPLTSEGGTMYYKPVQVFFDGLAEYEVSTATGGRQGGDGQQASHWRDDALRPPSLGPDRKIGIMDPNLGTGSRDEYNENDLRVFEVLGYTVTYDPAFAEASFTVNGVAFDVTASDSLAFLDLGDVAPGGTIDLEVGLTNESAGVTLAYSAEVIVEAGYPADVEPTLAFNAADGTVAPGDTGTLTLSVGAPEATVFYGTLRIETNVDEALVFDVPFRFSVGGATPPRLDVLAEGDEPVDLGDFPAEGSETKSLFTIANEGTLPLEYQAALSLARRADPYPLDPSDTDLTAGRPAGFAVLFEEDFEGGDLGDFTAGGAYAGDWQVIDIGPATLEGHSTPNAAYFGQVDGSTLQYRNLASGILISPSLDLSAVPQEDLVVLSFNTFHQVEVNDDQGGYYDVASVLISFDDGESFQEVASSGDGILENTTAWETIEIELPLFSGYPGPVRFAFQFISDPFVTDLGWLIDDVVLETRTGENPVFITPVAGTLVDEGSQELTVTVRGESFDQGYYRGSVQFISNSLEFSDAGVPVGYTDQGRRVIGVAETVPFTFTVGDPAPPILTVVSAPAPVSVPANEEVAAEVEITNTGDAELSYVRVLEPALSLYGTGVTPPEAPTPATAARDSLYAIELPGLSAAANGIAQIADGRIVVADGASSGNTYVIAEDLSAVEATLDGFTEGPESIAGIAFNEATGTLWFALTQAQQLVEVALGETAVEPTGETVDISFIASGPGGIAYSSALDVFFVTERQSDALYAVDIEGTVLPGYPVRTPSRAGTAPGLTATDGVLEVFDDNLSYVQFDQFGRLFAESEAFAVERARLGGSPRINGMIRSRSNPDGVVYYLPRASGGVGRVVAEDPADLPAYVRTPIEAAEPLFGLGLEPGATRTLSLRVDGLGRMPGVYTESLSFLTNNPDDRVVRIPVELTVTGGTAGEDAAGLPTAFALHAGYPNPFADRTTLRFDLPVAARASVAVYNVLGQRVATLLDGEPLEVGRHEVAVDARSLASGTYVVRLTAGAFAGSKRITVVK